MFNVLKSYYGKEKPDDEDNYQEFDEPEVKIINEYVVIPEFDI